METANPYQSPVSGPESNSEELIDKAGLSIPSVLYAIARIMATVLGACLLALLISGLGHTSGVMGNIHRWAGHILVILLWNFVPIAVVAVLVAKVRLYPLTAICQVLIPLLTLLVSLPISFTGYLGPSHQPDIDEEILNRFYVLHCVFLPSLLAVLISAWFFVFRLPRPSVLQPRSGGSP